jgi:hypothetical protein
MIVFVSRRIDDVILYSAVFMNSASSGGACAVTGTTVSEGRDLDTKVFLSVDLVFLFRDLMPPVLMLMQVIAVATLCNLSTLRSYP